MTIYLPSGEYGAKLLVKSGWTPELERVCIENNVKELDLSEFSGWDDDNLKFLSAVSNQIESLSVQSSKSIDLLVLETLTNLKSLSIGCPLNFDITAFDSLKNLNTFNLGTSPSVPLKLNTLPLTSCQLQWSQNIKSILQCSTLQELGILQLRTKDLSDFIALKELQSLRITQGSLTSLSGIEHLSSLTNLGLYRQTKLSELRTLGSCTSLINLTIEICKKVNKLDELAGLTNLRHLSFDNCGEVESLKPLVGLINVSSISFIESTNVRDGDLGCLLKLPKLASMSFADRKHYSHTKREWHVAKFPNHDWPKFL